MDLTKCSECGYEVTAEPDRCPNCGVSMGMSLGGFGSIVRRILFLLLAAYVLFAAFKYF